MEIGRPLERGDADRIAGALSGGDFLPAEYSFANLWLFRKVHRYRLVEEPVPHVRGVTYDGEIHALPLVDLTMHVADALFAGGVQCLYPFGEDGLARARILDLEADHEAADSDYWYHGSEMATLSGAKLRRGQARSYAVEARPLFEPWHASLADEADAILKGWAADITRPADETDFDQCREAIARAGSLDLVGGLVRSAGAPVAFLLASATATTRIVHFAKGRRAHSGAYPWLFAEFAMHSGAAWINFEQDLGITGLAQSKRAYAPARIQPKYRLRKHLPV